MKVAEAVWRLLPILKRFRYRDMRVHLQMGGLEVSDSWLLKVLRSYEGAGYICKDGDEYVLLKKGGGERPVVEIGGKTRKVRVGGIRRGQQGAWEEMRRRGKFTLDDVVCASLLKRASAKRYCNALARVGMLKARTQPQRATIYELAKDLGSEAPVIVRGRGVYEVGEGRLWTG